MRDAVSAETLVEIAVIAVVVAVALVYARKRV